MTRFRSFALALVLILIFTIPWEGVVRFAGGTTATRLIGIAAAAAWLPTLVISRRARSPHLLHVVFYFFVMWSLASAFWSIDVGATLSQVVRWAQLLAFSYIIWDLFTTRESVLAGLQAYILGAYVAIAGAVYNFIAGSAFYTNYQRFSPGETNPDGFGFVVALGIPVAFYLGATIGTNRWSGLPPRVKWLLGFVNYLYVPVAVLGLSLAGTRTALIAAIPGMAFGLWSLTRHRLRTGVVTALLLLASVVIVLPFVQPLESFQRFGTTYDELTEGDLNRRVPNWLEGLESFEEHPMVGVGSGTYRSVNTRARAAHNSFLGILAELGLIGFVLFGSILAIAVLEAWSQFTFESRFWLSVLLVWAIGAFALTWEDRRSTWLFLTLLIASAHPVVSELRRSGLKPHYPAAMRS